jgi:hypothetical protein
MKVASRALLQLERLRRFCIDDLDANRNLPQPTSCLVTHKDMVNDLENR